MRPVYITYADTVTPLGNSLDDNFAAVTAGKTGLRDVGEKGYAAVFTTAAQQEIFGGTFSREFPGASAMLRYLLENITRGTGLDLADPKTLLILCSTKGDIEELSKNAPAPLLSMARKTAAHFRLSRDPLVISNACISGIHGLIHGQRLIASGICDRVVVAGADTAGDFVLEGFSSLMALSPIPCMPFDKHRKGISLGEGAAAIVLEHTPGKKGIARLMPGAISNDANHITGPSRDGSGLAASIRKTLSKPLPAGAFISAHGTGTLYNDEMEALAFHACGLTEFPTHSLKGYFGHTLGAAGLLETAVSLKTLETGILPASLGYAEHGVSVPLHINREHTHGRFTQFLKTGSGFGGCNAAILVQKIAEE